MLQTYPFMFLLTYFFCPLDNVICMIALMKSASQDVERDLAEILLIDFVEGRTPAIKAALHGFMHCSELAFFKFLI